MVSQGCLSMPSSKSSNRLAKKISRQSSNKTVKEDVNGSVVEEDEGRGTSSFTVGVSENARPEHLVILVNGIGGSALDWKFAAQQFKEKLADKVVVHCSASNSALRTFNGIDIMGNRLAEEVMDVIRDTPGVTKISFVSHSLGGLISRYAIGQLYAPPGGRSLLQERSEVPSSDSEAGRSERGQNSAPLNTHARATVAGLEPVNFITLATPHLGCRGNRHLPFLFGIAALEKTAPFVSHWFVGRTGRHLFLADANKTHQALLQRMVTDCDEGRFISALRSFKQRAAYANIFGDRMVGWRTASIRRAAEMPEAVHECIDPKYPHIVRVEELPAVARDSPPDGVGESTQSLAADAMEESMIVGLQQVPWKRVDVSFMNAKSSYQAHNLIQVKTESSHKEGEDVTHHFLDTHF